MCGQAATTKGVTMRIAILRADLPAKFNKVAKYMGRHWPAGKLAHNKSRETLALLLGYNSYYELDQVADSQELPIQIQLNKIVSSMVVRAVMYCNISIEAASALCTKLPLKELSIYKVTDKYLEDNYLQELSRSDPKFQQLIFDEAHLLQSYKSPEIVINQYHEGVIPPYSFAVSKNGLIFSASRYERLIEKVGGITDDVLESESITRQEIIDKFIMPKAWLQIDEYLHEKDASGSLMWRTPNQVQVFKCDQGYLLYNAALKAYYPNIYSDFTGVTTALKSLYLGKPIVEIYPLSGKVEVCWLGRTVESDYEGHSSTADFSQYLKVDVNEQVFYLTKTYSSLGNLGLIPSLSEFQPMSGENDYQIPSEFVDPTVLAEYCSLFKTLPFIRKRIERKVKLLNINDLKTVFSNLSNSNSMTEVDVVRFINDDEDCTVEEIEHAFELGGRVLKMYPELAGQIDQTYLGYSYQQFSQYEYYNSRSIMVWGCDDREPEFLVFIFLSLLGAVKLHEHEDYTFIAGGAVFTHYLQDLLSGSFDVDLLVREFKSIRLLQKQFHNRWESLLTVADYCKFLSSQNEEYLSHGSPSPYTEKSGLERFSEIARLYRKTGVSGLNVISQSAD